jgi:Arc/MetJ-type ribon-helix-helix transcriptional regulator
MAITLDPATEQRIQRELDRGHYASPAEVIAQALDLLEAEQEWLEISKSALNQRLEQSMAQIDRGEGIPGGHLLQVLAERRQAQPEVSRH